MNPDLNNPPACGIWQYSSTGSVPGITGNVDMNAAYKDYPALIHKKEEPVAEKTTEKTEVEKAREWAIKKGISDGTNPDAPATRSQVWTMLYRLEGGK